MTEKFKNIAECVYEHALQFPQDVAIEMDVDGKLDTIDYGTLYKKAACLAEKLLQHAKPGDRALLIYPPCLDFTIAFIACCLSGIIAVPAYPPINSQFANKLSLIIKDCNPALILTTKSIYWKFVAGKFLSYIKPIIDPLNRDLLKLIDRGFFAVLNLNKLMATSDTDIPKDLPPLSDFRPVESDEIAFLQYTSGTTDTTKGVMVTHKNILVNIKDMVAHNRVDRKTRFLFWQPHYHDMGLIGGILVPLYVGCLVRLMSPFDLIKSPIKWLRTISEMKANLSGGPTFAFNLCLKISEEEAEGLDLSSWNVVFCGAEPIRSDVLKKFVNKFSKYKLRKSIFVCCYGLAESTLWVSGTIDYSMEDVIVFDKKKIFHEGVAEPSERGIEIVSCGKWPPDQDLKIIDPNTYEVLPEKHVGKIVINGPSIAAGYWNRPELSASTFKLKISNGKEYLDTGDLGFLYKGELFVTGRIKEILIIHGVNYYPQPIEQVVEGCNPLIKPGGVAVIQRSGVDQETLTVVAEVKTEDMNELTKLGKQIENAVLKDFSLKISSIYLVKPKFIPKTTSGKMARFKLQDDVENKPGVILKWSEESSQKPTEEVFQSIINISKNLGLGPFKMQDRIEDFFDDSLKQMQLLLQLELSLGCEDLPYSILGKSKTFEDLIKAAEQWKEKNKEAPMESKLPSQSNLPAPPMALMIAKWMGEREFNLGYVCDVNKKLNPQDLVTALQQLTEIQPYLTASFDFERSCFRRNEKEDLVEIRKIHLSEDSVKAYLEKSIKDLSLEIKPSRFPLFKLLFIENTLTQKQHLLLVASHFIVDPISIGLFFEQLEVFLYGDEQEKQRLKRKTSKELETINALFNSPRQTHFDFAKEIPPLSEEEYYNYKIDKMRWEELQGFCKLHHLSLDATLIGISIMALKSLGIKTDLCEFLHQGRTLMHPEHPISHLISWLAFSWSVNIPENHEGFFQAIQKSLKESSENALASIHKTWYSNDSKHEDPFAAEIEYNRIGLHHLRTPKGFFSSSNYFLENWLHGDTFAKLLPRYRKVFIRPFIHPQAFEILFFFKKGCIDSKSLDKALNAAFAEFERIYGYQKSR